jgi:hypothetical protein
MRASYLLQLPDLVAISARSASVAAYAAGIAAAPARIRRMPRGLDMVLLSKSEFERRRQEGRRIGATQWSEGGARLK